MRYARYVVAAVVVVVLLGALALVKWSQVSTLMAAGREAQRRGPPPEAVNVATLEAQQWETTLPAIGTVASGQDVAIRNELAGVVTRVAFESGAHVRAGDVLVQLDTSVERADLQAAMATERLTAVTAERTRGLTERGVQTQAELDTATADHDAAAARVASLRATIEKKTIRAPFSGRVGIRAVNAGELLAVGTTITTIGGDEGTFVDFTLPQAQVSSLREGMPVRIGFEGQQLTGSLLAIEPQVSSGTRAIGLRAVFDNDGALRPGMFVDAEVVLPQVDTIVVAPATAIVHAAYGDSVFVVGDLPDDAPIRATQDGRPIRVAEQIFVRVGRSRGDFVELIDGPPAGREVVSAGGFKLRNGSTIYVAEPSELRAQLDPRPESR